jgi:diguanylate cyclase (GGDEF)-like protein
VQANDTVFAAEAYAAHKMRLLLTACVVMLAIMALTWLTIFWAYSQKLFKLEGRNKELSELARRDALTGVYQLDPFKEEAQRLLDSLPQERFAVVYTDFADFKYVNDVFGYRYGDRLLARYGELIRGGLQENEVCGRVSADNFVLLLRYREKEEVAARQRALDQAILRYLHIAHDGKLLPTCCGICCVEDVLEELKIDGLLDRANFARKTVKNGTNHNYVYYDESIRRRLWEEKEIEGRMQGALERQEFIVYYQPKVCLSAGKIGSAEALVRWRAQDGSLIPPDRSIPVFERRFMIDQLDQYVFAVVCRWLRGRLDEGKPVLPVAVNVSRLQFYDHDFVKRYVEIRDRYSIPPELLEIEFTESIAIENSALLLRIVSSLKEAGFPCSIDDFGKGYSSLGLLKDLPIDTLKIDSLFFRDGPDHERDLTVVQSIVELVKKLRIKTVAEGIESLDQVAFLRRVGCDYVQGFVYYRPMPAEAYESLLAAGRP